MLLQSGCFCSCDLVAVCGGVVDVLQHWMAYCAGVVVPVGAHGTGLVSPHALQNDSE